MNADIDKQNSWDVWLSCQFLSLKQTSQPSVYVMFLQENLYKENFKRYVELFSGFNF